MPPPPEIAFEERALADGREFYAENKRVSNRAGCARASAMSLLHPTYREGLAACLAALESEGPGAA